MSDTLHITVNDSKAVLPLPRTRFIKVLIEFVDGQWIPVKIVGVDKDD